MVLLTWLLCVVNAFAGTALVGTAPLVADGNTTSTVRAYVERCPSGARARVKAESGKVSSVAMGADCVVSFEYTPPAVSQPKSLPVAVIVQGDEQTIQVPVVPPFAGELTISFDPVALVAGQSASVKIVPSGTSPVAADRRRFVLTASTGTVDPAVSLGDGTYAARYTAPKTLAGPVMVAITAVDAAAPRISGIATLPLLQKKTIQFDAPAGSTNVLAMGGQQLGPFKADSKNKVTFELNLDPRLPTGRLTTVNLDTSKVEKEVPIPGVPQGGQLVFLPLPASVVAGAESTIPLRAVALTANGEPQSASDMLITASAGTVATPGPDGRVMQAAWTLPTAPGEVTLGASWNGLTAQKKVRVLSPLPRMTLAADPPELPSGGGTVKVFANLKDAGGTSLAGRSPQFSVEGGSLSGSVKDNKDGSYLASVTGSSKTDRVRVYGAPQVDVSSLAPARILAWTMSPTVAGNGLDTTTLTVVAVDAFDLPVPNVEFKLAVPRGDGVLPPAAKSDAKGIARVTYKAGTAAGLQTLRVEGAGLVTELPVFQVGKNVFASPPPGGSAGHLAALERWQTAAPSLVVIRAGVVPKAGPPASVMITTTPGYTTPGAAILVQVRVADDAGAGVAGQKLAITAAPATVGTVTDNRDGSYAVPVQLPAGTDGPLEIRATAGSAAASLRLPTLDAVGSTSKAATASTAPSSAGSAATVVPRATASSEVARGRFGGVLVNTRGPYALKTNGNGGAANAATEAPGAGFWGLALRADYGLPVGPGRVNFHGQGRFTANWYALGDSTFLTIMRDLDAGVGYVHGVADMLAVGGRAEIHALNAPYFTYTDDTRSAAQVALADYLGARVMGLLELDTPSRLHVGVELGETFAPVPAATHASVMVDVPVGDAPVAVRGRLSWDYHYLPAEVFESKGTIDEHVLGVGLGATYVLD